jgi:hypothetical protein
VKTQETYTPPLAPSLPAEKDQPEYAVRYHQGAWEILHRVCVKTCLTEKMARAYAQAWNDNRHPTNAELSVAL